MDETLTLDQLLTNWDDGAISAHAVARFLLAQAGLPDDEDAVRLALRVHNALAPMVR